MGSKLSIQFRAPKFLLLCLILSIFSCSEKTVSIEDYENTDTFRFSTIIDSLQVDGISPINTNTPISGNHYPRYFGKLRDSLFINSYNVTPQWIHVVMADSGIVKPVYVPTIFDNYFFKNFYEPEYLKHPDTFDLNIHLDTNQIVSNWHNQAYPVIIKNMSSDTLCLGMDRISLKAEAKKNGLWHPIEEYSGFRGFSSWVITLPPNEIVLTSQLIYSGDFKTKLRLKMGNNYSEEFGGYINESQFEHGY